jgi:hypothetical protein
MAQTGDQNASFLAEVARARETDGNRAGGLERVVRMAQSAALVHEAQSLGAIRPDLVDEEPMQRTAAGQRARVLSRLIRPTGPVFRRSPIGVAITREQIGLDEKVLTR